MANQMPPKAKKTKFDLSDGFDDFDDLESFGMDDDFDFQGHEEKESRKPVPKLKRLKAGAIEGFSSQLKSSQFQKDFIKKALPEGYGKAMDTFEDITDTAKTLYDNVNQDIKPQVREFKKTLRRMLPGDTPENPKSLKDRLKKLLDTEEDYRTKSRSQMDDENATIGSNEIFAEYIRAQSDQMDDRDKVQKAKESIKDTVSQNRFETTSEHMMAIRTGMERLVGYQDKITINFQRKSLELQFKHLFTAQHHLDQFEKFAAVSTQAYKDLVKNTGLPDVQKLHESERAKDMLKRYGLSKLGGTAREFLGNMPGRMKQNVLNMGKDFGESFKSGLEQAQMMAEMMEMGGGIDPMMLAGNVAGGTAADALGGRLAKWVYSKAEKMPKVMGLGKTLGRVSKEYPARLNAWASNRDEIGPWHQELAKDVIGGGYQLPGGIREGSNEHMDKVAYWNHKSQVALTEVIPGWLSRMYSVMDKAFGGGSGEMEHWDYASGQFVKVKDTAQKLHDRVYDKPTIRNTRAETEKMLNMLIPSKDDRDALGSKGRNALRSMLLNSAANAGYFEPKNLVKKESFTKFTNGDDAVAEQLATYFQGRFPDAMSSADEEDEDFGWNSPEEDTSAPWDKLKKKVSDTAGKVKAGWAKATDNSHQTEAEKLSEQFFRMGESYSLQSRRAVWDTAAAGYNDAYRSLGVVGRKGDSDYFDHQKFMSEILDENRNYDDTATPSGGSGTPPPGKPNRGRRRHILSTEDPDAKRDKLNFSAGSYQRAGFNFTQFGKMLTGSKDMDRTDTLAIVLNDHLVQEIRKASSRDINQKILELLTKFGNDSGHGGEPDGYAPHHHSGGVVGRNGTMGRVNMRAFMGAKRYHQGGVVDESGYGEEYRFGDGTRPHESVLSKGRSRFKNWLKKGEVPAVLQQDEEVLKRSDPRHIFNQAKSKLHNMDEKLTIKNYLHDIVTLLTAQAEMSSMGFAMGLNINMNKAKSYFRRSMGSGLRVGKDVLSKGLGFFGNGLDFMRQMGVGAAGAAMSLGGMAWDQSKKLYENRHELYGKGQDLFEKGKAYIGDLYVKGSEQATLRYDLLKKSEYFDATTGKVIKTWDDIKGAVKDKKGNIILTAEEAKNLYTSKGKPIILRGLKYIKDKVTGAMGMSMSLMGAGKLMAKTAWDWYDVPSDVYLEGETEPRLYAHVIRNGGYFQKKTKHPVKGYKDIVGTIVDAQGNIVLSVRDYAKKRLVDKSGKPLMGGRDRIMSRLTDAVDFGKNVIGHGLDLGKKVVKGIGKGFGKLFGLSEDAGGALISVFGSGQAKVVDKLDLIYKVLDDRLPNGGGKAKAKKAYELDEKGLRKGSWEEKEAEAKDKKGKGDVLSLKADPASGDKKGGGGFIAMLLASLGSFAGSIGKLGEGVWGMTKAVWEVAKFIGPIAKGLLKFGWGAAKLAGRVGMGALRMGAGALEALPGIIGTAAEVVGVVAEAGAAVLTAPVTLAVAATIAVVYGGWKLYKYLSAPNNFLTQYRLISYGVDPEDHDKAGKIADLENMLSPLVDMGSGGKPATLKAGKPLSELLGIFGVHPDDHKKVKEWSVWFQMRFKPIFLSWMTINGTMNGGKADLTKVDTDLKMIQKIDLMTRASMPFNHDSPYSYSASPWSDDSKITIDPSQVKDAFNGLKEKIIKLGDPEKKKPYVYSGRGSTKPPQADDPKNKRFNATDPKAKTPDEKAKTADKSSWFQGRGSTKPGQGTVGDMPTTGSGARGMTKPAPAAAAHVAAGKWSPKASGTLDQHISAAAQQTGVSPTYLKTMAMIESGGNPQAVSPTGAVGIYQFTKGTGKQYGLCGPDGDIRSDEAANVTAGAQLAADNQKLLKHILGNEPEPWMLYMAHQQGAGGVAHILKAAATGGDVPSDIRHNMDVNGGKGMDPGSFLSMWKIRYAKNEVVANSTSPVSSGKAAPIPGYNADGSPSKETPATAFFHKPGSDTASTSPKSASPMIPVSMTKTSPVSGMPTPTSTRMDRSVTERNDTAVRSAAAVDTQRRSESQSAMKSTGNMVDLMQKSVQIQQSMDDKLGMIADLLKNSQTPGTAQPQAGAQQVASGQPPQQSSIVRKAMEPPISVGTRA